MIVFSFTELAIRDERVLVEARISETQKLCSSNYYKRRKPISGPCKIMCYIMRRLSTTLFLCEIRVETEKIPRTTKRGKILS